MWVDCRPLNRPGSGIARRKQVEEKGLSAYLAELIGTLLLVFFICTVVILFLSTGSNAQFGTDFAVIGLVHAFCTG